MHPLVGVPAHHMLRQRTAVLLQAFMSCNQRLGVHKLVTSCYDLNSNGRVERVNHTMAHMLALWSSTSVKTIGTCIGPTSILLQTIKPAGRRVWRPTRSARADSHSSP